MQGVAFGDVWSFQMFPWIEGGSQSAVGCSEEGGQLTEPVRRRPYCVLLFDEMENL